MGWEMHKWRSRVICLLNPSFILLKLYETRGGKGKWELSDRRNVGAEEELIRRTKSKSLKIMKGKKTLRTEDHA